MSWDNLSNKMGYDKLSDQPSTMGIQPNIPFKYIMGHDGTDALGFNDTYIYNEQHDTGLSKRMAEFTGENETRYNLPVGLGYSR